MVLTHDTLESVMEENLMKFSSDTSVLMIPQPVLAQSAFALLKRGFSQIRAFKSFGFKYILTAPRGRTGKHVKIDGVVRNSTKHFHQAFRTSYNYNLGSKDRTRDKMTATIISDQGVMVTKREHNNRFDIIYIQFSANKETKTKISLLKEL
jgi:hypothetical protein